MSNPSDPNSTSPVQSPNAYAPPAAPESAPTPRKKWLVGCLGTVVMIVSICAATMLFSSRKGDQLTASVIQDQANALAAHNDARVCSHNTPRLQSVAPCAQFVAWMNTNAPWFSGSNVTRIAFFAQRGRMRIDVHAAGAGGVGNLRYFLVENDGAYQVDGVFLLQQSVGLH